MVLPTAPGSSASTLRQGREIETYVKFSSEAAAKDAKRYLTDQYYKVWLLDEEEFQEVEYSEGRKTRKRSGTNERCFSTIV